MAAEKKMLIKDITSEEAPPGLEDQEAPAPMVAAEGWVRQTANTSIRLATLLQLQAAVDKAKAGEERETLRKLLQEARPELKDDLTEEARAVKPAKGAKRLTKAELAAKATPASKPAPVPGTQSHVWQAMEPDGDSEAKDARWACTRATCGLTHTGPFASLPKTRCIGSATATASTLTFPKAGAPGLLGVGPPPSPIPAYVEALLTSGKESTFKLVKITDIVRDPKQPRKTFNEAKLQELAESIASAGVIEPLVIRPTGLNYELVCGERRQLASIRAIELIEKNTAKLPAAQVKELVAARSLLPCIVRDLSPVDVALIQGIENVHRDGLTDMEEAEHYERLESEFDLRPKTISQKLGVDLSTVYARLKLCALIPAGRKMLREGKLIPSVALLVARIPKPGGSEKLQAMALKDVGPYHDGEPQAFRGAAEIIGRKYTLNLKDAPFDVKDEMLYTAPGSCTGACGGCPFRSGNCRAVTPDIENADVCTNPEGYAAKVAAHVAQQKERAEGKGYKWIADKDAKELFGYGGQLHFNAPFVALDTPHPEDPKRRTWRQLLKGAETAPQIYTAASPQGAVVVMVDRKEAKSLLAKSDNPVARHESHQEKTKAESKEEKRNKEIRDRIALQLLEKLGERALKKGLELPTLRALAELIYDTNVGFGESEPLIGRVLGIKGGGLPQLSKLELPQLFALLTILVFADEFSDNFNAFSPGVRDAAKLLDVDLGALEKLERLAGEAEEAMAKGDAATLDKLTAKAEQLGAA